MKKIIFVFVFLLLIPIMKVEAFSGDYIYDITKFEIGSDFLTLKGWAAINGNNNTAISNVNPKFTLNLVGIQLTNPNNPSVGIQKLSYPYTPQNGNDKNTFTNAWNTAGCEATWKSYENIGFTFNIPYTDIQKMMKADSTINALWLTLKVEASGVTREISIGVYDAGSGAVANIQGKENLSAMKGKYGFYISELFNPLTDAQVVVSVGITQRTTTYGGGAWYYSNGRLVSGGGTKLFYGVNRNYRVIDTIKKPYGETTVNFYTTNIGYFGYKEYQTVYDCPSASRSNIPVAEYASDGSTAYVPSFWAKPPVGKFLTIKLGSDTCRTVYGNDSSTYPGKGEPAKNGKNVTGDTCCQEICSGNIAAGDKQYCEKKCNTTTPPPEDICKDITDTLKQYCCYHPESSVCKEEYPDEPPTTNPGTCSSTGTVTSKFQFPKEGWGTEPLVSNDACKISCQEKMTLTFNPRVEVKAGMGFEYPISINSSRYCTADYDNEGWKTKVDTSATAANTAYNNMVNSLNKAKQLDDACGAKQVLTAPVPACPSPYTDGRSALTCTCTSCHTCWNSCPTTCSGSYACGTAKEPKTCSYSYPCSYPCNPYPCAGSTGLTCPSIEGHASSYVPDHCEVSVCSKNHSKLWSTAQAEINVEMSKAANYRTIYNANAANVSRLNTERNTCDNYVAINRYNGASNVATSVRNTPNQSSYTIISNNRTEDTAFESKTPKTSKDYSIYICNNNNYVSPTLVGDYSGTARTYTSTYCDYRTAIRTYYDFWNKKSDSAIRLEFSTQYYVQDYTGEILDYASPGYVLDGRKSYTGFYDMSSTHGFDLTLANLGPNIPGVSNSLWSVNPFTCQYDVTNWIFPPEGDHQRDLYGGVAFMYRQVTLIDPFPNRSPGWNWSLYPNTIAGMKSNGYKIYGNPPRYTIDLDRATMMNIVLYNNTHNDDYGTFNTRNPYDSLFFNDYIANGVIRRAGQ